MSFLEFVVTTYNQHSHTGFVKCADDQGIKLCMGEGEKLRYSGQNDKKNFTKLIGDAEFHALRNCNSFFVFLFLCSPLLGWKEDQPRCTF